MALIKGQRSLAARLGIKQPRVQKLMQSPDWRWGRKEWTDAEIAEIQAWRLRRREDSDQPAEPADPLAAIRGSPERAAKLKLVLARVQKLEDESKLFRRDYILKADVERENVAKVLAVRQELMNTPRLMAMLEGCTTPAEQEEKIRDWAKGVCDRFAGA